MLRLNSKHKIIHGFVLIACFVALNLVSHIGISQEDQRIPGIPIIAQDSNALKGDSITEPTDTLISTTSSFKSKVTYHAEDSLMIDNKNNKAFLWGQAWVKYENIELKADYLEIDFEKNEVVAKGMPDSTGKIVNTPVFVEAGKEYQSGEMTYNFQTKKGLISKITTQESDGYIHGDRVKMENTDVFYIRNGRYTTCNLDHPHYYVQSNKLKIINNDKIVTGPAYMAIEDVPTFLAVPFGFFPNQDSRNSGVIPPALANSATQGFGLENGGYYFGFSDQADLLMTGSVFTNGTWTANSDFRYKQRYLRAGNLRFSYTNRKAGEPDTKDFSITKSWFLQWRHTQDPKARPNSNFSAAVKLGSSDYYQNDQTTQDLNYLRNEFTSNISYSQKFGNSPFTLTATASHNQNNNDSLIFITLPEVALNMARIFPFKRKVKIGKDKWYEKIGMTYSGGFKNQLESTFEDFGTDQNIKDLKYGVKHDVKTNTSVKLGHFSLNPQITYGETWYFQSFTQRWDSTYNIDPDTGDSTLVQELARDTTAGFYRFGDLAFNASLTTKVFGIYQMKNPGRVKAIRHTVSPTIGFSYKPNLAEINPEMFGTIADTANGQDRQYTIFDNSVYGVPNGQEYGTVSFELLNVVEMKRKKRSDTTDQYSNVNLIEAWTFRTGYNLLADEYNWENLYMDVRTSIGKAIKWRLSSTSDFYGIDAEGNRIPTFNYELTKNPFRLTRLTSSVGLNLSGDSKGNAEQRQQVQEINPTSQNQGVYNENQYVDFNVPWNATITYVFTYLKPGLESEIINSLAFQGSINLTPAWKLGMSSSYDFDLNQLGFTRITVNRDLHCWQIDFSMTPFGARKSYMVNIRVKQGFLQDLKLTRNSRWVDG